jgi:hypothetical protein
MTETGAVWKRYEPSRNSIEIDITYDCNVRCFNCNRSCTQAPTKDNLSLEQIDKFIKESINNNIQWHTIRILGGEPTLHPQLLLILDMLIEYRVHYSGKTTIQLVSNGCGKKVTNRLSRIPHEVTIENSRKTSRNQTTFSLFNIAPIDTPQFKDSDFSGGCWITSQCGIGLTPYGYYQCAIAGGIDRIFGFDKGIKTLSNSYDKMLDLFSLLCRYCGHFFENERYVKHHEETVRKDLFEDTAAELKEGSEMMSPTWVKAYNKYRQKSIELTRY